MRKRAEHHPHRVHIWGSRPLLSTRCPSVRGPRRRRTEVWEFNLIGADGFYVMRLNPGSQEANDSLWDKCCGGNSTPGVFKRDHYVEGKAKPKRPRVIKRYK